MAAMIHVCVDVNKGNNRSVATIFPCKKLKRSFGDRFDIDAC